MTSVIVKPTHRMVDIRWQFLSEEACPVMWYSASIPYRNAYVAPKFSEALHLGSPEERSWDTLQCTSSGFSIWRTKLSTDVGADDTMVGYLLALIDWGVPSGGGRLSWKGATPTGALHWSHGRWPRPGPVAKWRISFRSTVVVVSGCELFTLLIGINVLFCFALFCYPMYSMGVDVNHSQNPPGRTWSQGVKQNGDYARGPAADCTYFRLST